MLRKTVRQLAQEKIAPRVKDMEKTEDFPQDLVDLMAKNGLIGLTFPEKYGGMGGDKVSFCIVLEELARISGDATMWCAQSHLGSQPLLVAGSEEQKQRFMPRISAGETICAFGLTEPEAGSDVAGMRTRAIRDGDSYVLNGSKCFISFANVAKVMTLFAKTDPAAGYKGISAFVLETDTPGFSVGKLEDKMGLRSAPTVQIAFDDCRIPRENLLGQEGDGWKISMVTLDVTRPGVGAMGLGMAQGALDVSIEYAKQREQFGSPIASFQGIQFMLADMAMQIEAARLLVYKAAALVDEGSKEATKIGAMAKCFATDVAMKVTTDAVQILGGYGYIKDYPVERYMREAKVTQIFEGTNQVQRLVISRELVRQQVEILKYF